MSKTLFNETNEAAIAVSSFWAINLQEKLKQDRAIEDLPANAFYVKTVDTTSELIVYINDTTGDSYLISAGKDLFISGVNVWTLIIKNQSAANEIAIGDVTAALYKQEEVV